MQHIKMVVFFFASKKSAMQIDSDVVVFPVQVKQINIYPY